MRRPTAVAVVVLLVATLLSAAAAASALSLPTTDRLAVSRSADRSAAVALQGANLAGSVVITAEVAPATQPVTTVTFWVDDPARSGTPTRVERTAPFDLAGGGVDLATLYDTRQLRDGSHSVTALLTRADGTTTVLSSTFTVTNTAPGPTVSPAPSPAPGSAQVQLSTSASRSAPRALAGATVSGQAYVFVPATTGVVTVDFYLDDPDRQRTPLRVEDNPPYDLVGGTVSTAKPLDTRTLADGSHTVTAVLTGSSGAKTVVQSAFTVTNGTTAPPPSGPAAPSQVHLSWTGDSARTMTVVWRTRDTATPVELQVRRPGETAWRSVTGSLRAANTPSLRQATATGLLPDTTYEYRVRGDGGAFSPVATTRTVGDASPFSAVFVADTGLIGREDGLASGTAAVYESIDDLDPHVVLGGGDYAYYNTDKRFGTLERSIDAWFDQSSAAIHNRSPFMPTYGNHEVLLGEGFDAWADRFATPTGVAGAVGVDARGTYAFDVGSVRFLSISAPEERNGITDTQVAWVADEVADAEADGIRWVVPYLHGVPLGEGLNHPVNQALQADLGPLMEASNVPLVLYAHDQSFERSYPLTGLRDTRTQAPVVTSQSLTCYSGSDGVVWLKSGPGGKRSNKNGDFSQFRTTTKPAWSAVRGNTASHITEVEATATALVVTTYAISDTGTRTVADEFRVQDAACPGAPPPPPPAPAPRLLLSTAPERTSPVLLDGRTVSGQAYVFVDAPPSSTARVQFWVDDPNRTGPPDRDEGKAAYDLAGTATDGRALAFDVSTLSPGRHTVTALVRGTNGVDRVLQAAVTVG